MENIAPPLKLLLLVKRNLEKGHPARRGVLQFLQTSTDDFAGLVSLWHSQLQQGQPTAETLQKINSVHRRMLLLLLERALRGEGIYSHLCQLETEIIEACHDEIACKLSRLPLLLLFPLLLMQFPAILMLLFGPLLQNFFHSLGGG